MASLSTMIEELDGLRGTKDLAEWEVDDVNSIIDRYLAAKKDTRSLSGKQVEIIDRIWNKHFAG